MCPFVNYRVADFVLVVIVVQFENALSVCMFSYTYKFWYLQPTVGYNPDYLSDFNEISNSRAVGRKKDLKVKKRCGWY